MTSFQEIKPENVETKIQITGIITEINPVEPILKNAVFECKSCTRLHEVIQKTKVIHQPAVCKDCGGESFKLVPSESTYTEKQILQIQNKDNTEKVQAHLYDDHCCKNYTMYSHVNIEGILHVQLDTPNYYFIQVVSILPKKQ